MTSANQTYQHDVSDTLPISDDGLRQLDEKAWRRSVGPPSTTYTLRVTTLRRLIFRIQADEAALRKITWHIGCEKVTRGGLGLVNSTTGERVLFPEGCPACIAEKALDHSDKRAKPQ